MTAPPPIVDDQPFVLRRLAKNTIAQLTAYGLNMGAKAIAALMVARWLGPDGLGTFSITWTIAQALSVLSVVGLDYLLIRELARSRDARQLERAFPLAMGFGLLFAVLFTVGALLAPPQFLGPVIAGAIYVVLSPPALLFRAAFHAYERMEIETGANAVEGAVAVAVIAATLVGGWGVMGAVAGLAVGRVAMLAVGAGMYVRLWGRVGWRFEPSAWLDLLRHSFPMGVSYIFSALYLRFDIILLGAFVTQAQVGVYSAAAVVILTVPILATSMTGALYPALSRVGDPTRKEFKDIFDRTARLALTIGVPVATGLTLLATDLMVLAYGEAFAAAGPVLVALSWVLPARFVNNLFGVALNATDRQGMRTRAVMIAAAANLVLNLALIPSMGIWGAVWATVATEVVLTVTLVWALRPLRPAVGRHLAAAGTVTAAMVAAMSVVDAHVLVEVAVGGAVACLGIALFSWPRRRAKRPSPDAPLPGTRVERPGLTAVVLTRNERPRINRILDDLKWADELLVIDACSDDGTAEAAAAVEGCRVVVNRQRDFASQRNLGLSLVRTEWVLWIDADWILPSDTEGIVRRAMASAGPDVAALCFRVIEVFCGTPMNHHRGLRPRLHRTARGRWVRSVHERLELDGRVEDVDLVIHHRYADRLDERIHKTAEYARLSAEELIASGYRFRLIDLFVVPARRTLGNLIIRRGILDGIGGLVFWSLRGLESFLALSHVWAAQRGTVTPDTGVRVEISPASEDG